MSNEPSRLPDLVLRPSLHVDKDTIFSPEFGPTLAQLVKKQSQEQVERKDFVNHLALVLAIFDAQGKLPVEYAGNRPVPIAREVIEMLGEFIATKSGWGVAQDYIAYHLAAVQKRDATLRRLARERGYPSVAAIVIAAKLLADPGLMELTTIGLSEDRAKKEGRDRKPMEVGTLAKIISDEDAT
jgi:hypothetical protein